MLQETTLNILNGESGICSKHVRYNSSIFYCALDDSNTSSNVKRLYKLNI